MTNILVQPGTTIIGRTRGNYAAAQELLRHKHMSTTLQFYKKANAVGTRLRSSLHQICVIRLQPNGTVIDVASDDAPLASVNRHTLRFAGRIHVQRSAFDHTRVNPCRSFRALLNGQSRIQTSAPRFRTWHHETSLGSGMPSETPKRAKRDHLGHVRERRASLQMPCTLR